MFAAGLKLTPIASNLTVAHITVLCLVLGVSCCYVSVFMMPWQAACALEGKRSLVTCNKWCLYELQLAFRAHGAHQDTIYCS